MSTMSASDAAPLPRLGEVFFDVRGSSRSMRLSWYADTGVSVFSIWQGGTCTGTFRLPMEELPRLIDALQRGMPSADQPDPRGHSSYLSQLPGAPTDPRLTALPSGYSGRDADFTGPVTGDFRALRADDAGNTVVFSPPSPRTLPPGPLALPPPQSAQDYSAQYPEQSRPVRRGLPADGYGDTARYQNALPAGGYGDRGQYQGQSQYPEPAQRPELSPYPGPAQYSEPAQYPSYPGQGQYQEQSRHPGYADQGQYLQPSRYPDQPAYQTQGQSYSGQGYPAQGYADQPGQGYDDRGYADPAHSYADQGYARSSFGGQAAGPEQGDRGYPAASYTEPSYPAPPYSQPSYPEPAYPERARSGQQYDGPTQDYSGGPYSGSRYDSSGQGYDGGSYPSHGYDDRGPAEPVHQRQDYPGDYQRQDYPTQDYPSRPGQPEPGYGSYEYAEPAGQSRSLPGSETYPAQPAPASSPGTGSYTGPRYGDQAPVYQENGAQSYPDQAYGRDYGYAEPDYPAQGYGASGDPAPAYQDQGYTTFGHAERPGYENPGYAERPGYDNPGYESPGYPERPGYESPGYENPGYAERPGYEARGYEGDSVQPGGYREPASSRAVGYPDPDPEATATQRSVSSFPYEGDPPARREHRRRRGR